MGTRLLLIAGFLVLASITRSQTTVVDIDGNTYNTVTIGTQLWMKENLRVRTFNNGTAIPEVSDNTAWSNLTSPGFCWYENNSVNYNVPYGVLYNGYVISNGNICPVGWRLPADADWNALSVSLGGSSVAGGKMKETGTSHWASPNTGATNESGFTALPGGARFNHGGFTSITTTGRWWSSTSTGSGYSDRSITNSAATLNTNTSGVFRNGFSVRCVKDVSTDRNELVLSNELIVYPNPAKEFVTVRLDSETTGNLQLNIYNSSGMRVLETELNDGQETIDLTGFREGLYLVNIKSPGKEFNARLIVR